MNKTKVRVAFTSPEEKTPQQLYEIYRHYAPGRSGQWNYLVGTPNVEEADVVFMMEGCNKSDSVLIKKLKTKKLFVIRREPPDIISSCHLGLNAVPLELRNKTTLIDYTSQPIWFFSTWQLHRSHSHEDFLNMSYDKKIGKLSCLVSDKVAISGHRKRLDFIKRLVREAPNLLTLFGRNKIQYVNHKGVLSNKKKYKAYEGFEYTLCCENTMTPNYFSDKILDAMLMWSIPLYWGAPNVSDYLPQDSYHILSENLDDSDIEKVKDICAYAPAEKNIKALKEARQLILKKYMLWPSLQHILEKKI